MGNIRTTTQMNIRTTTQTRQAFKLVWIDSEMTQDEILGLMCNSLLSRVYSLKKQLGITPWNTSLDVNLIHLILYHDLGKIDDQTFEKEISELTNMKDTEWSNA